MLPLTIITVVYNDALNLSRTISSVKSQTFTDFEYIIVDGKSTDNTLDVISQNKEFITAYISEEDLGIYDAMNKGIFMAKGKWINFMNAGDVYANFDVLASLNFNQEINYCIYGASNKSFSSIPNHQSMFILASWHRENLYNLKYKIAADYAIKRKLISSGKIEYVNVNIVTSLPGGASQTLNYCSSYISNAIDLKEIDLLWSRKNKLGIHLNFVLRLVYANIRCFFS